MDLAAVEVVEEALTQRGPLQDDGGDEEVDGHGAVTVALQERHQKAEADEHHDVHVLEHCVPETHTKRKTPLQQLATLQPRRQDHFFCFFSCPRKSVEACDIGALGY